MVRRKPRSLVDQRWTTHTCGESRNRFGDIMIKELREKIQLGR